MESNNRPKEMSWVWGGVLIVLGGLFLLGRFVPLATGLLIAAVVLVGIGLTFFTVYWHNREQWWALIPAYVMWVGAGALLIGAFEERLLGIAIPVAIGLPFLYVYLHNREHWWALIPTYIMFAVGLLAVLDALIGGRFTSIVVMLLLALPFFYVYIRNRAHWWALIPAGIFTSIGLGIALVGLMWLIPVLMIGIGVYLLVRQLGGYVSKNEPSDKPPAV